MKSEYGDWVEPAPNPLPEILDSPKGFLSRYLVFKKPSYPTVIALWTAHTWVIQCFDYTPHLYISSPVKRCGKTRVFDCLGLLCAKPWRIVNATGAVLFRKIEKDCPSLLLDEVDTIFSANGKDDSKEGLRCVLNTGFERKATVPRCVGPQFELKEFHVFCPKAFAGIGKLPDTVADRSIEIAMVRKARNESAEKLRVRDAESHSKPIKTALEAWSADLAVIQQLHAARPKLPEELGDRAADIASHSWRLPRWPEECGRQWRDPLSWNCAAKAHPRKALGSNSWARSVKFFPRRERIKSLLRTFCMHWSLGIMASRGRSGGNEMSRTEKHAARREKSLAT
jgi:hypothetical protein